MQLHYLPSVPVYLAHQGSALSSPVSARQVRVVRDLDYVMDCLLCLPLYTSSNLSTHATGTHFHFKPTFTVTITTSLPGNWSPHHALLDFYRP